MAIVSHTGRNYIRVRVPFLKENKNDGYGKISRTNVVSGTGRNKKWIPEYILQWVPFLELEELNYGYGLAYEKNIKTKI